MTSHAESSTPQVIPASVPGPSRSPRTYLRDEDDIDTSPTPRGLSPDAAAGASKPTPRKSSLRFSDSNRPRMSTLLDDQQSHSPPQPHKTTNQTDSPIEEEESTRRDPCERERERASHERDHSTDSDGCDSQSSSQQGSRGWKFKPVLVLENSGSVARDHLASERTFLAYVRTSLAIASTGVALVQLFTIAARTVASHPDQLSFTPASKRVQAWARPLGVVTVSLGIAVLMIGVLRYFTVQNALVDGKFPVARFLVAGIAFVLGILVTIVFGVLVSGAALRG